MNKESENIYRERGDYSISRLSNLKDQIGHLDNIGKRLNGLTIFCAGSYARHEASQYSDIDMFFLCDDSKSNIETPHTDSLILFGKMIEIIRNSKFPEFSNDCQYLKILHNEDIIHNLGSPTDDHENYFTVRMLLLLESQCLYGDDSCNQIKSKIIKSYFTDYPDHPHTFKPIFLLNDICRFWKTLLLNYENKRNLSSSKPEDEERLRRKQKVRNFKLKYSRMTTCFATIAALGSYEAPTEKEVLSLSGLTPHKRLESIKIKVPDVTKEVDEVLDQYAWFLEMTGLDTESLEKHFAEDESKREMFAKANQYGDAMFKLLSAIDSYNSNLQLLRYLVI